MYQIGALAQRPRASSAPAPQRGGTTERIATVHRYIYTQQAPEALPALRLYTHKKDRKYISCEEIANVITKATDAPVEAIDVFRWAKKEGIHTVAVSVERKRGRITETTPTQFVYLDTAIEACFYRLLTADAEGDKA